MGKGGGYQRARPGPGGESGREAISGKGSELRLALSCTVSSSSRLPVWNQSNHESNIMLLATCVGLPGQSESLKFRLS